MYNLIHFNDIQCMSKSILYLLIVKISMYVYVQHSYTVDKYGF